MATNTWTPTETVYADREGNIVSKDDPARATVVAQAGQPMLIEKAKALGLISVEGEPTITETIPEAKAKQAPANTKDVKGPGGTK